jgi:hypothetical protein
MQHGTEASKAYRSLAEQYVEEARQRASNENIGQVIEMPGAGDASGSRSAQRQSLFRRGRRSA